MRRMRRWGQMAAGVATIVCLLVGVGYGGGGFRTLTTTATLVCGDIVNFCDTTGGTFVLTLPSAVICAGGLIYVKKTSSDANSCTLTAVGGQTIEGFAAVPVSSQGESGAIISDGSNWWIVADRIVSTTTTTTTTTTSTTTTT